jgi:hypothetical protein
MAEFLNILAEFRVALSNLGTSPSARTITRYLPHPTHHLPFRSTWDIQWLFSPEDILELLKRRSILVIDERQIKSQMPEPEIAGAMERIEFQPGVFQQILCRGSLLRMASASTDVGYNDHVLVVSNAHWKNADVALVRVIGYHVVTGHRVKPFDDLYGTRIFVIPSDYCDVEFPRFE